MFSKVKYKKYGKFAGPFIKGANRLPKPSYYSQDHWNRVLWLTSQVESGGVYGSIVGYDGTGITAGLIQQVSIFPVRRGPDGQGPLWKTLQNIKDVYPDITKSLEKELLEAGWILEGGIVKSSKDKRPIHAYLIREELTPGQGKVERGGLNWSHAKTWALIFHDIFSDPRTWPIQNRVGIEFLQKLAKNKAAPLKGASIQDLFYGGNIVQPSFNLRADDIRDLTLSVILSYGVNAPYEMYKTIQKSIEEYSISYGSFLFRNEKDSRTFCELCIKNLGTSPFGRWSYIHHSGRYQRSRKLAMKLWPEHMFEDDSIMPSKIK